MSDETTIGKTRNFVPKTLIYDDIGPEGRPISAWWLIPQLLLIMLASIVFVIIFGILGVVIALVGGAELESLQDPTSEAMLPVILMASFGIFVAFFVISMAKTKMENRSLASMGLDGFLYGARFWQHFGLGIGLAVILTIPTLLLGIEFGAPFEGELDWSRVLTPGFAIGVLVLLVFLMIQSPSEELLFRGWMFSGLSARHGLTIGIVISSVMFGLFHGDRFIVGAVFGIYYVIATASLGLLLAAVSYKTKSVIPASGLHTGYNFTLFVGGIAFLIAASDDGNFLQSFMEALDVSNLEDPALTPALMADMAARFLIPASMAFWLIKRRNNA